MSQRRFGLLAFPLLVALDVAVGAGCQHGAASPSDPSDARSGPAFAVSVTPAVELVGPGGTAALASSFEGSAAPSPSTGVKWSVQESGGGTVDSSGNYTAPKTPGMYHVIAASVADPTRSATAVVVVGLTDPSRVTTWQPGIPGGIPARTTVCATIKASDYGNGTTDSSAAVQKAIDGCAEGGVVVVSAGTFLWLDTLDLNKGITLRGAGNGQTIVNGNNTRYVLMGPSGPPSNAIYATMTAHTLLTADAQKGATTLTVADGSAYKAGDIALVTMKDDATLMPPPSVGGDFLLWIDPDGSRHSIGQTVTVASVSGNTLTIQGVLHSAFTVANAGVVGRAPSVVKNAGIEGIRFVKPQQAILVSFCDACWITGSETDTSGGDSGWWLSRRGEMHENYIHNSQTYAQGGGGYGLTLDAYTSDMLIENNIIYFFNKPFLFRASGGGNVVAYNYIDGAQDSASPTWMEPDIDSHMVYSHMELVEGNLSGSMGLINTWGGAGACTFFRNRVLAQHQDPALINQQSANQAAFTLNAGMGAYSNILGNVLGLPGLTTTSGANKGQAAIYENVSEKDLMNPPMTLGGYAGTQAIAMYRLGNGSEPGAYASFDVNEAEFPKLAKIAPTVIRDGNFDYVTNSVKADKNVPDMDLPSSLYLGSKPSFFEGKTWPWVEATGTTKVFTLPAKELYDSMKK